MFFILVGAPGTGKSVFCDVLTALVGRANVSEIEFARFGDRFGLRPLTEKLLNFDRDVKLIAESGSNSGAECVLKKATQGEPIIVEDKGVNPYSAGVTARLVFACNDLPYIADKGAVFDRVRIIPFNQRIRGTEKQNPNLAAEIAAAELPGVLNWALVGLAKLRKLSQFPECPEGAALKDEHRNACDHEREFLTVFVGEAPGFYVSSDQLFKKYQGWMLDNGYRPTGAASFKRAVKRVFPKSREDRQRAATGRITVFHNIKMINDL